jgi:hypothetical protein
MKKTISTVILLLALSACATPEVITERQVGDSGLNCSQIAAEIQEAETFKKDARSEKGVTGTNIAAGLLFWPALLVTYSNSEEAIQAAGDRQDYLQNLADSKGCRI